MTKFAKDRSAIKTEESDEEGVHLTAIKVESDAEMLNLPLKVVLDLCLASRSPAYVDTLLAKLKQEGFNEPRHLKQLSREFIESSLGTKQHFDLGEVSDVVGVRDAIVRSDRNWQHAGKKGSGKTNYNRHHVRSRSRNRSSRRQQRPQEQRKPKRQKRQPLSSPARDSGPPPALWKATEEGNLVRCRQLLEEECVDVDEPYKLWTPLMKARINSIRNTRPGFGIHKIRNTRSGFGIVRRFQDSEYVSIGFGILAMDLEYSRFGILVTDSDYWPQISGQGLRILAMYSESWTCRPNPGHVFRIHRISNPGHVF